MCRGAFCYHNEESKARFEKNHHAWNALCETRGWLCPITQEPLDGNSILASDGFAYNRAAFEQWHERFPGSLIGPSGAPLLAAVYVHADVLRQMHDHFMRDDFEYGSTHGYLVTKDLVPSCQVTREPMKQPVVLFPRGNQPAYDKTKPDQKGELQTYYKSQYQYDAPPCREASALIGETQSLWCQFRGSSAIAENSRDEDYKASGAVKLYANLGDTHVLVVDRMWLPKAGSASSAATLPALPTRGAPPTFDATKLSEFRETESLNYPGGAECSEPHANISYSRCTFVEGDPKSHTFRNCRFSNCTFNVVCWCSTRFEYCRFENCTWNIHRGSHNFKATYMCEVVNPMVHSVGKNRTYSEHEQIEHDAMCKIRGATYALVKRVVLMIKVLDAKGAATDEKFVLRDVRADITVRELEQLVAKATAISAANFTLFNPLEPAHRMTNHSKTLMEYGIRDDMTLYLRKDS